MRAADRSTLLPQDLGQGVAQAPNRANVWHCEALLDDRLGDDRAYPGDHRPRPEQRDSLQDTHQVVGGPRVHLWYPREVEDHVSGPQPRHAV